MGIIDSVKCNDTQLVVTKFPILTDHKPQETFMDRIKASHQLCYRQEFLVSFDQTIVHAAAWKNFIADAIFRNYMRIGTWTEREDFIPESINNTTLDEIVTRPSPTHTITCNDCCIPPVISDM